MDFDDYELKYSMFLAESELYTNMINIGGACIYESVGLISIQESLKETVTKYIGKVREALHKAFEKFQKIIGDSAIGKFADSIKDKIASVKPEFTVKNFSSYNIQKLDSIKTVPLDMDNMKENLESKEKFISTYWPELSGEGSMKERIEKLVKGQPKDIHADANLFKEGVDYILKTGRNAINSLKTELATWEAGAKALEAMSSSQSNEVSQTTVSVSSNGSTTTSTGEAVALFESCLLEADDDKKMEIVPDEGSEKSDKGKSFTKYMTTYTSVNIDILSAKMAIYKDIFNQYVRILTFQFGKPKTEEKKQES